MNNMSAALPDTLPSIDSRVEAKKKLIELIASTFPSDAFDVQVLVVSGAITVTDRYIDIDASRVELIKPWVYVAVYFPIMKMVKTWGFANNGMMQTQKTQDGTLRIYRRVCRPRILRPPPELKDMFAGYTKDPTVTEEVNLDQYTELMMTRVEIYNWLILRNSSADLGDITRQLSRKATDMLYLRTKEAIVKDTWAYHTLVQLFNLPRLQSLQAKFLKCEKAITDCRLEVYPASMFTTEFPCVPFMQLLTAQPEVADAIRVWFHQHPKTLTPETENWLKDHPQDKEKEPYKLSDLESLDYEACLEPQMTSVDKVPSEWFVVPFEKALDAMSSRGGLMAAGQCYVTSNAVITVVKQTWKAMHQQNLKRGAEQIKTFWKDERIRHVCEPVCERLIKWDEKDEKVKLLESNLTEILDSMPLCMKNLWTKATNTAATSSLPKPFAISSSSSSAPTSTTNDSYETLKHDERGLLFRYLVKLGGKPVDFLPLLRPRAVQLYSLNRRTEDQAFKTQWAGISSYANSIYKAVKVEQLKEQTDSKKEDEQNLVFNACSKSMKLNHMCPYREKEQYSKKKKANFTLTETMQCRSHQEKLMKGMPADSERKWVWNPFQFTVQVVTHNRAQYKPPPPATKNDKRPRQF